MRARTFKLIRLATHVAASCFLLFLGQVTAFSVASAHTSISGYTQQVAIVVVSVLPNRCVDLITHKQCPLEEPDLQIEMARVSLSQALALHEAYIVLPPENAPRAAQIEARNQIVRLMYAKRDAIRLEEKSHQHPEKPNSSCETTEHIWGWPATFWGDNIQENVAWSESPDCSTIDIYDVTVQGITAPNADYFDRIRYASVDVGMGCPFLGTNTIRQNINKVGASGYTIEFWIDAPGGFPHEDCWLYNYDDHFLS